MRKKSDSEQKQLVSKGSVAIQAGEDVHINFGLTYNDVKEIVLSLFKENFIELSKEAGTIAQQRAEEITDKFLSKLKDEFPEGLQRANDPDFQFSLYTIQKEYARNGDRDLSEILVDLLVDRSKLPYRDILQIVLNESLNTAPKLTEDQISALSLIFLFVFTINHSVKNHDLLGQYFDHYVFPFSEKISKKTSCYRHLAYSNCGTISSGIFSLPNLLGQHYQGLFFKGFSIEEIEKRDIPNNYYSKYFIDCLNDTSKKQLSFVNKNDLKDKLIQDKLPKVDQDKILSLFDYQKMSDEEIRTKCLEIRPYMENIFDIWKNSEMCRFNLTSVGIAIGHANIKRITGYFTDLSIWIN